MVKKTGISTPGKPKKKIIRVKRIDPPRVTSETGVLDTDLVPGYQRVTVNPGTITAQKISSGAITSSTITSAKITTGTDASSRVVIHPTGEMRVYSTDGQTYTLIGEGTPVEAPVEKTPKKREVLSFRQEDLDAKDRWTTAEAAWFCGMSRSTWHVRMHKSPNEINPVALGEGRGKQNIYLAEDVRKYKAKIGR